MKVIHFILGSVLLLLVMGFAVSEGATGISWSEIGASLAWQLGLRHELSPDLLHADAILWSIRMPRVLMAALSGAGLSLVGASIQALVRNPMADPWLLGVSSGASLGAVLVLIGGLRLFGELSLPLTAFLGAVLASGIIYHLARDRSALSSSRLIFTGLAISFSFEACTQLLIFSADHPSQIQNVMFWTMGSLGAVENDRLLLPFLTVGLGFFILYRKRHELNIACLSDAKAHSLGINLSSFRLQIFLVCAGLTSVLVSVTGSIGFVGLMVPHLLRLVTGHDYRRLIPACLLGGAFFMVLADFLARNVFDPQEIPIGVLTALLGSPLFIWLMRRSDVQRGLP
jgi:iron complex transport system permease protein